MTSRTLKCFVLSGLRESRAGLWSEGMLSDPVYLWEICPSIQLILSADSHRYPELHLQEQDHVAEWRFSG